MQVLVYKKKVGIETKHMSYSQMQIGQKQHQKHHHTIHIEHYKECKCLNFTNLAKSAAIDMLTLLASILSKIIVPFSLKKLFLTIYFHHQIFMQTK